MIKQRPFLKSHGKKIDYAFLTILLLVLVGLGWFWSNHYTYTIDNKLATDQEQPGQFDYENFWHKFNTYTVIMLNMKDRTHLVSQFEVERFQGQFFKNFGLVNDNRTIEHAGNPVDPDVLFCYMQKYDPKNSNANDIIKSCIGK